MKKGFTLIELMAVIIIISLLAILTFPNIVGQIKKSKNAKNNNVNAIVISATKKYINDNPNEYDKEEYVDYCITIKDLVDNDYLKEDIVSDEDNNLLDYVVNISYEEDSKYEIASKCSSNYTELKYIESTGTQYFDTNFYPNQDTSIEFVAETTDIESVVAWFGGRNYMSVTILGETPLSFSLWQIANRLRFDYKDDLKFFDLNENDVVSIYWDKNKIYINDEQVMEFAYSEFISPSTLAILGVKTYLESDTNEKDDIDNRMAKLRLYSCKIWDNGKLIRDYIPVLDKNNVACLYDKVGRKYYYNQGTGDFIYQK